MDDGLFRMGGRRGGAPTVGNCEFRPPGRAWNGAICLGDAVQVLQLVDFFGKRQRRGGGRVGRYPTGETPLVEHQHLRPKVIFTLLIPLPNLYIGSSMAVGAQRLFPLMESLSLSRESS